MHGLLEFGMSSATRAWVSVIKAIWQKPVLILFLLSIETQTFSDFCFPKTSQLEELDPWFSDVCHSKSSHFDVYIWGMS